MYLEVYAEDVFGEEMPEFGFPSSLRTARANEKTYEYARHRIYYAKAHRAFAACNHIFVEPSFALLVCNSDLFEGLRRQSYV